MSTKNIFSFLKKHKTFLLIGTFFAGMFLLGFDSVFAAEDPVISPEDSEKVVKILNGFITGAAALMGMVTSFITMFLYPGWVNGTLFGLQDYLKIMWILISNIVYFIFAFILIAIAFMNIINKGEGTWELKQAMPKFIIGVLIVPFSWFFVQFILSLSAILTVGVLTLPYDSFSGNDLFDRALENEELAGKKICKDVVISFNGDFSEIEGGLDSTSQLGEEANDLDENIKCLETEEGGGKITISELLTGKDADGDYSSNADGLQNSIFGVMSIYSYGILKIDELDTIHADSLQSVKSIADLIFKVVFDVLFIAVYLLLMIALLLALFVRGVRLWIYMMLSPAFGLLYFFGKGSDGLGESGDKFNIKEFIALALVPVYVSAALAFGLVFILVASEGIKDTNDGKSTLKAGGFSLTIIGAHGDTSSTKPSDKYEKSIIAKLIVEIFGVVILWIAVMAALGASKTTKAIVEPIAAFGKSVGDLAAKAPTYAPIIPTGQGKERMSVASLPSLGSALEAAPRQEAQKRGASFADGMIGPPGDIQKVQRSLDNLNQTEVGNGEGLKKSLESMGAGLFKQSTQRDEQIRAINSKLGLEIDLGKSNDPKEIARKINEAISAKGYSAVFDGETKVGNYINRLHTTSTTTPPAGGTTPNELTNLNLNINSTNHITDSAGVKTLNDDGVGVAAVNAKALSGKVKEDELEEKLDELVTALGVSDVRSARNAIIDELVKNNSFTFKS